MTQVKNNALRRLNVIKTGPTRAKYVAEKPTAEEVAEESAAAGGDPDRGWKLFRDVEQKELKREIWLSVFASVAVIVIFVLLVKGKIIKL